VEAEVSTHACEHGFRLDCVCAKCGRARDTNGELCYLSPGHPDRVAANAKPKSLPERWRDEAKLNSGHRTERETNNQLRLADELERERDGNFGRDVRSDTYMVSAKLLQEHGITSAEQLRERLEEKTSDGTWTKALEYQERAEKAERELAEARDIVRRAVAEAEGLKFTNDLLTRENRGVMLNDSIKYDTDLLPPPRGIVIGCEGDYEL
jgi:hypothetical protein